MPHLDPFRYPQRKRIRLPAENCACTDATCSITTVLKERRPIFADHAIASAAVEILRAHAVKAHVPVFGYCIMPDHVHLIVAPSPSCDIPTFVGQFKNLTQRAAWQHGVAGAIWQQRYWDHFLRAEEQVERVVEYVLNNPVRRGMVKEWREYPFCGSLELTL